MQAVTLSEAQSQLPHLLELVESGEDVVITRQGNPVARLEKYVQPDSWQIRDIKAGIAEADAGDFASSEEVQAVFAKYGA